MTSMPVVRFASGPARSAVLVGRESIGRVRARGSVGCGSGRVPRRCYGTDAASRSTDDAVVAQMALLLEKDAKAAARLVEQLSESSRASVSAAIVRQNVDGVELQSVLDSDPEVKHMFQKLDVNNDGVITAEEYKMYADEGRHEAPSTKQLFHYALRAGVPFIGFGFLDNALMITAGTSRAVSVLVCVHAIVMFVVPTGGLFRLLALLPPF